MVNSDYCVLLGNFTPAATINTGEDTAPEHTGNILNSLSARVLQMPPELQ